MVLIQREEMTLVTVIRQYLQGKRYVVVSDDVWKVDFWGFIKYVLPENGNVASSDFIYKLQPLSSKSSWKLFCKKNFRDGVCPPELKNFSVDIVEKCGGLPLAIVTISGLLLLRRQNVFEWKRFSDDRGRN